ncbi:MAG: pitrilysin family protein [Bradymonadales bacterium]|jgi:zinc protease
MRSLDLRRGAMVIWLSLGVLLSVLTAANAREIRTKGMDIPYESFVLDNGMQVFLLVDRSLPVVALNMWFDVGSKNERAGRTGFAHLFEHLMFMGTERVPDIDLLLESGGGSNNASTSNDVTNYYTVAPENMLERLLFIEADRLANLASSMTSEKLDKQREVVLNERRQMYENQPYGKAWLEMPTLLYPEGHPYAHPVIGSEEDIRAATLEDVLEFFNSYYTPANVSLVLAGDFDAERGRALVEKYFGAIKGRKKPESVQFERMRYPAKERVVIEDKVQLPRLVMFWHSPAFLAPGDAELDILSSILCKGKNSRLINSLVYEKQLASSVNCAQMSSKASTFIIDALPLPGVRIEALEEEILAILKEIGEEGVREDEFARTKNSIEMAYIKQLQTVGSRADNFNSFYFYSGSTAFPSKDLQRYRDANTASLMQVYQEIFLDPKRRATLIVEPEK